MLSPDKKTRRPVDYREKNRYYKAVKAFELGKQLCVWPIFLTFPNIDLSFKGNFLCFFILLV